MAFKCIEGMIIQTYNEQGKCITQEFIAAHIQWVNEMNDVIDCPIQSHKHHPFKMIQPKE